MIDVSPVHLQIVLDILKQHAPDCDVRVFGSRYANKAKKYSDLDIVLVGNDRLPVNRIAKIKETFEESILPYRVDILDWNVISPEFRKIIEGNGFEVIQKRRVEKLSTAESNYD
ncbi:MAG: nucleotidyltransferase domain-containing protein [Chloroflexi bacterium]|nr:nucleotidyltransferase domain-containing protein [Chloroflexota bacterium]